MAVSIVRHHRQWGQIATVTASYTLDKTHVIVRDT